MINSALVSAQNRVRLYWTNISKIQQPKDKKIYIKDILLEDGAIHQRPRGKNNGGIYTSKAPTLTSSSYEHNNKLCIQVGEAQLKGFDCIKRVYSVDGKSPTLTTMTGGHREPKISINGAADRNQVTKRGIERQINIRSDEKSNCVVPTYAEKLNRVAIDLGIDLFWRKLTPVECERLQTLPDNYTQKGVYNGVIKEVSASQRNKALGNGWTVEVIKHIYQYLKEKS